MRPCSTALAAYLAASDTFIVTDLYTFALATGEVLRYSGWTTVLQIPGTLFPAGSLNYNALDYTSFALGPRFGRSRVATRIGVAPTELDIDIFAGTDDRVGSVSFADAIRLGLFDGATVELDRLFAPPEPNAAGGLDISLGALVWFTGRVAECDAGRSSIRIKVKSLMHLLAIQQMIGGVAYLLKAWLYPVAAGDNFRFLPGCDHTVATCDSAFNNLAHYGGFPYIPLPETAV